MDTKIIIFGVLFSFGVGFYFGTVADFEMEQIQEVSPSVASLEKSFKQITRKEIGSWENIESPERKRERAFEILTQATQATINTLNMKGVKLSDWSPLWGEEPSKETTPPPTPALHISSGSHFSETVNVFEKIARTMKKGDLFNEDNTLKEPARFLSEAQAVSAHTFVFDRLQGTVKGEIELLSRGDKTYYLSIRSDFTFNGKELTGNAGVELSDETRGVFSTSTSEDAGSYFFSHPEDDQGLIVLTSKTSFVYLTLNRVRGTFSGHYYERDLRSKSYRLKGRIHRLARTAY